LSAKQQAKKISLQQKIVKLWLSQLTLLVLSTLLLWLLKPTSALSVLLGGLIYWVPNAYFTLYAFRFRGAQAAILILRSIYRGEFGKILLTAIGFALVFVLVRPIDPVGVFASFIGMTLAQLLLVSRW